MQPSPVLTRLLLAVIFLIALPPLVSYGQAAAKGSKKAGQPINVNEGEVKRINVPLNTVCLTPQLYQVKSHESFFRFDPPADSVTLTTYKTLFPVELDARKMKPGTYSVKLTINCLNCTPATCKATQKTAKIKVKVVKQTPQKKKDESFEGKAEVKEIEAGVKKELKLVSSAFKARRRGLSPIKGVALKGQKEGVSPEKEVEGYNAKQVRAIIKETKRDILNALGREELRPLKDYVAKYFPQTDTLNILKVETASAHATSTSHSLARLPTLEFHFVRARFETTEIATVESAQKAFENVGAFIELLESNDLYITLTVNSDPVGANVDLMLVKGKSARKPDVTNATIQGVWRGIYLIKVTKDGFLPIVQEHELGFPYKVIECTLVKSGTPQNCRFR